MEKVNSVFSLTVTKGIYDAKRPYQSFKDKESSGSGFIIDINKGYVLTNAHVVRDAISIVGRLPRTGKRDISLELVGFCREKDLALIKISAADIPLITTGLSPLETSNLNLKIADSMFVKPGDSISTIGYPLDSQNIKITTGVVSGFERVEDEEECSLGETNEREDSISRSPTYIQISAAINPGNSGGPLLNNKNEVIGINAAGYLYAQNIGYAIPSRTFLAIFPELLKLSSSKILNMPTISLDWCRTNREIMKKQTGSSSTYGIYVRKVYPDSCLDSLERGDIIRRIDYIDYFWKANGESNPNAFNINREYSKWVKERLEEGKLILAQEDEDRNKNKNKYESVLVTVFFDRFGMSTKIGVLKNPKESNGDKFEFEKIFTERKMEISEIMDMVPVNTSLQVNLCRLDENGPTWYLLQNADYEARDSDRITYAYNKIDFEIFGGLCVTNLNMNVLKKFDNLKCYGNDMNNLYCKKVIIVQIFPESQAYKTDSLREGALVKSILAYDANMQLMKESHRCITSLEDVRFILALKSEFIQITCSDDSIFLYSTSSSSVEDKLIKEKYRI